MKLINNTKSKVSINRHGLNVRMFPGEECSITRLQVQKLREVIDYFGLLVVDGKEPPPIIKPKSFEKVVSNMEVIDKFDPAEEKFVEEKRVEEKIIENVEPSEFDDKTVAELRVICKEKGLSMSGNRVDLIEKLKACQKL